MDAPNEPIDEVDQRLTPAQRAARRAELQKAETLPLMQGMREISRLSVKYQQLADLAQFSLGSQGSAPARLNRTSHKVASMGREQVNRESLAELDRLVKEYDAVNPCKAPTKT